MKFSYRIGSFGYLWSSKQANIVVPSGNNVPLTPITFTVDATGGIKLNLTANKVGGPMMVSSRSSS